MGALLRFVLYCDGKDCTSSLHRPAFLSPEELRAFASIEGWESVPGAGKDPIDFCSSCAARRRLGMGEITARTGA